MRSISNLGKQPAGLPIVADEILELHAARLLLLFRVCGTRNKINGLTKMAKLDFFVRYPEFFDEVCEYLGVSPPGTSRGGVESAMVRHHYGPWDRRYYHVLAYLEGKGLLSVQKIGNAYDLELTKHGQASADKLKDRPAFSELVTRMRAVKKVFGAKTGSRIKSIIYEAFGKEVADKKRGEVIAG